MKLELNLLFIFSCFFFSLSNLNSQAPVEISLAEGTANVGDSICLSYTVNNFTDIIGLQWSTTWDTSIVEYLDVDFTEDPLNINDNAPGTGYSNPNDSSFAVIWIESEAQLTTLAPGTELFSICFQAKASGSTDLFFDEYTETIFLTFNQDGEIIELPVETNDGALNVLGNEEAFVLPGDTNNDSIVSADDLLNIGLAYGATGPARQNASTDFFFQPTTPWLQLTPQTTIDYALIDTDGNGQIGVEDQTAVSDNFGLSLAENSLINGVNAPISSANDPLIFAESAVLVGGQFSAIELYLGDDDNPVDPGYGISFSLEMEPDVFDLSDFSFDASGSFLGDDLLAIARRSVSNPNVIEIALVRKDQQNSDFTGGLIGTLNVRPNIMDNDVEAQLLSNTIRYLDRDENTTGGGTASSLLTISAPVKTYEPIWAAGISLGPNPLAMGTTLRISYENNILTEVIQSVMLLNPQGRTLATYPSTINSIDLSSMPSGNYLLRFDAKDSAGSVIRRLIIH